MSTSATRHQNFRFEFETVKNARTDAPARPWRLLQVSDGRHDHGRPQTSIATLLRRLSVTSLAHRAHSTSHHDVRKSPHRRLPVERTLARPCRRPRSREGTVSSGSSTMSTGDGHVSRTRVMACWPRRQRGAAAATLCAFRSPDIFPIGKSLGHTHGSSDVQFA